MKHQYGLDLYVTNQGEFISGNGIEFTFRIEHMDDDSLQLHLGFITTDSFVLNLLKLD